MLFLSYLSLNSVINIKILKKISINEYLKALIQSLSFNKESILLAKNLFSYIISLAYKIFCQIRIKSIN